MILNGKAKEEFEKWILNNPQGHESQRMIKIYNQKELFISYISIGKTFLNALIIDWFDSVGIYISTPSFNDTVLGYQRGHECEVYDEKNNIVYKIYNDNDVFNTRQEATEKAIDKANLIFNSYE